MAKPENSHLKDDSPDDGCGGKCMRWLKSEFHIKKEMIPIKLMVLTISAGIVSFLPYLTVHMRSLGIRPQEIGIILAILPIPSFIGPLLVGVVADKLAKYRLVLFTTVVGTALLFTGLLLVPRVPDEPTPQLRCISDDPRVSITWSLDGGGGDGGEDFIPCPSLEDKVHMETITIKECSSTCEDEEFQMCLGKTCYNMTSDAQIIINATLVKMDPELCDKDSCSESWSLSEGACPIVDRADSTVQCQVQCQVEGAPQCRPTDSGAYQKTFWTYFIVRIFATLFMTAAFTIFEATLLALVKQHKADYGKQRIFGSLAGSVMPLISGALVDVYSKHVGRQDYLPAFVIGDVLLAVVAVGSLFIPVQIDPPSKHFLKDMKSLLTNKEISIFLTMFLFLGMPWGFIESFLFIYLKGMGAPTYLLGLTFTVGMLTGLPFVFFSHSIIKTLGRQNIFVAAFFFYAIRLFGYSLIENPFLCLPFEALEVFSHQVMRIAAVTYCPILAPKGLLATMTGVTGTSHYMIGKGLGALLGGILIQNLNGEIAFQVFGGLVIGGGIIYRLIRWCILDDIIYARESATALAEEEKTTEEGQPLATTTYVKYVKDDSQNDKSEL